MKSLMNKGVIYLTGLLFMMFMTFLITGVGAEEELTFKEALNRGLQTAGELRDVRENINSLRRTLASMKARQDWQLELGAQYSHTFDDITGLNGFST